MATVVTYPGQNEGAGAVDAKYLKLFTGEVSAAFTNANIGLGLVKVRTISGGKTAQFIVTGKKAISDVNIHTPGTQIITSATSTNEKLISITGRAYIADFYDELDTVLAQYDFRSDIAKQQGVVLASQIDTAIFKGVYDTRLVAPVSGQTASVVVTNTVIASGATNEAKGDAILASIFDAQAALTANAVPTEGRIFVTNPVFAYKLAQSQKALNADFNAAGSNGTIANGKVMKIAGLDIYESNNLPVLESNGITATSLVGMIFTPDVYGVVKAIDVKSEANYDFNQLGWLLTSYYAIGMGSLNPSCLAVIKFA